jgi:glyoxylase-like metal-dependent hydrolase (beta-lactamase superfamily II)
MPLTGQPLPFFVFVIEGPGGPVVVDTGAPGAAEVLHRQGLDVSRPPEQEPEAALARAGVDAAQVERVVLTHLHWDHCGNGDLFPQAEFFVQRSELQYAVAPAPADRGVYDAAGLGRPLWLDIFERMAVVEGDHHLAPGLDLLHVPGHTPGSQAVLVDGEDGQVLVAGDTVPTYAHWRGDAHRRHLLNDVQTDAEAFERSLDRIDRLGCEVLPSHDLDILGPRHDH